MDNQQQNSKTVTATLRYLRIAPRKTKLLAEIIKGLPVNEAQAQLVLSPRRASQPLLKLLRSAISNAQQLYKVEEERLYVKEIRIDQGPKFKRWMPRARGAVSPIEKRTSHVRLVLGLLDKPTKSRFSFPTAKKVKKIKKKEKKSTKIQAEKPFIPETDKEETRKGFLKRVFRRKSV